MKILSMKDRVKLTLGKITLTLKPLNIFEQSQISSQKKMDSGVETEDLVLSSFAYIKYSLKGIEGVKTHSGDPYELDFEEETGYLTDDCASEVFSLNLGEELFHAIQSLRWNSIPEKLTYVGTKKALKGVKLEVIPSGGSKV